MVKIKVKNTDEGWFDVHKFEADAVLLVTKEGKDAHVCIQGVMGKEDAVLLLARLVADAAKVGDLDGIEAATFATAVGIMAMETLKEEGCL